MILERPLAIVGVGSVSPLETERVPPLGGAGQSWPVFRVNLKQERLARWQNEARLRRASAIAVFMLEAAQQALAGERVDLKTLGIVAAFGTGAVIPTRRFYEGVVKSQRFASPNLFPETVFNSPTSHAASVLGVSGPCYSVLGDESAWVNAIGVAACWLANGAVEHALVIGAEEFDPIILNAFVKVRWLRRDGAFAPSEGAGALLLRRATPTDKLRVEELAEGFTYRNKREARAAAEECIAEISGADAVCRTAPNNWFAPIESELHRAHNFQSKPLAPYCGEAFTASAAWNTICAAAMARETRQRLLVPIWGLNEQCSALLLSGK